VENMHSNEAELEHNPRISRQNSAGMLVDFSAFFSMTCHHLLALKVVLTAY